MCIVIEVTCTYNNNAKVFATNVIVRARPTPRGGSLASGAPQGLVGLFVVLGGGRVCAWASLLCDSDSDASPIRLCLHMSAMPLSVAVAE
jgi:hypothetical protein